MSARTRLKRRIAMACAMVCVAADFAVVAFLAVEVRVYHHHGATLVAAVSAVAPAPAHSGASWAAIGVVVFLAAVGGVLADIWRRRGK